MSKITEVFNEVKPQISVSPQEMKRILFETKNLISVLKKNISKNEKIVLGGSLAKDTLIKKINQDIDIFVVFKTEQDTKNLKKIIKKSKLKTEIIHGSRDYFQVKQRNLKFEIIPIVEIKNKESVKNVTDFSPLHVIYINSKILKNPGLKQQIILAKTFFSANEIYGAESYIQGFSGYATELLICFYGSFEKLLKKLPKQDFIDQEKQFKNKKQAFQEINESKLISPLVLIDPTYKYRNVCAGLGKETFENFKVLANNFIKKPSKEFFEKKDFDLNKFIEKNKKYKLIQLKISSEKNKQDIDAMKMKKFFRFILSDLQRNQQKIQDSFFWLNERNKSSGFIAIDFKKNILIKGPSKKLKIALKQFEKTRKKVFFSKGFAFSKQDFVLKDFFEKRQKTARQMNVEFNWKDL